MERFDDFSRWGSCRCIQVSRTFYPLLSGSKAIDVVWQKALTFLPFCVNYFVKVSVTGWKWYGRKKMFACIVFTSTLQWWEFEKNVPITDLPNVVGLEKEKNYSRFISYVFDPNVIPSYQWHFNLLNHEEGLKQFSTIWHLSGVKANIPAV